jgi:glycine betaine/proline transport system substrate-binding protein
MDRKLMRTKRIGLVGMLSILTLALLAACGGGGGGGGDEKPSIGFIEGDWTSHILLRTIAEKVVSEQLDYPVHRIPLQVTPGWAALCSEEVHIGMEAWLPSRLAEIQPFLDRDCVELGGILTIGTIGWFVPRYLVEGPNAPAPDLVSITDLNDHWELFESSSNRGMGELMGGDISWIDHPQDLSRIQGYELNYFRSNQGEPVLLAEIKSRYLRQQPFLTYLWTPHSIFGQVDMVQLEEPDEYHDDCFVEEGVPYRCPHPVFDIHTIMNTNLKEIAPDVFNFIDNIQIESQLISTMMAQAEEDNRPFEEIADEWIQENQSRIDQWIAGNRA